MSTFHNADDTRYGLGVQQARRNLHIPPKRVDRFVEEYALNHMLSGTHLHIANEQGASPDKKDQILALPGHRVLGGNARTLSLETTEVEYRPTFVIVPGTGEGFSHRITDAAVHRAQMGALTALKVQADALVVSGSKGRGRVSEAQQMAIVCGAFKMPIIQEHLSSDIVSSAVCTRRLLTAIHPNPRIYVMSSWSHTLRQRRVFRRVYNGMDVKVLSLWGGIHGAYLREGLVGMFRVKRHVETAQSTFRGIDSMIST